MIIFDTNITANIFGIIPRIYVNSECQISLYNELRDNEIVFNQTPTLSDNMLYFEVDQQFKEGQSFNVEITNNGTIIYRGKAFAVNITNYEADVYNYRIS